MLIVFFFPSFTNGVLAQQDDFVLCIFLFLWKREIMFSYFSREKLKFSILKKISLFFSLYKVRNYCTKL